MADNSQQAIQLLQQNAQQQLRAAQDFAKALQLLSSNAGAAGTHLNNVAGALRTGAKDIRQTIADFEEALQADDIERTRNKVIEEYRKTLEGQSSVRKWFEDTSKQEQAERIKNDLLARREMQDKLASMINDNKQTQSELRKKRKIEDKALQDASAQLKAVQQMHGPGFDEHIQQLETEVAHRTKLISSIDDSMKNAKADAAAGRREMKALTQELADGEARLKDANIGAEGEKLKNGIGSWVTKIDLGAIAMAAFTKAVYDTAATIRMEMKHAVNLNESIFNQFKTAKLGMSRADYAALTGEYRRTIAAMGGLEQSTNFLADQQDAYYERTGDLKEATEAQMQAYQMLTNNGIKLSGRALKEYSNGILDSYDKIKFKTGLSLKQFTDTLRELEDDESTRTAMRMAATEDERRQIMDNNQARIKENLAMGMTRDQALAAAKAMNKMAGEKPLDRFKKSIRLQMAMGAMGVGGGEEAARIYRKPKNKRSKEEEAYLQERMSAYSNQMSTQMGSENLGEAAFAEKIGEKSGFSEEALADLNTKGLQPLKGSIDSLDKTMQEAYKSFLAGIERSTVGLWDLGKSILANVPAIGIVAGGIAAIAGLVKILRGGMFSGLGTAIKNRFGGGAGAPGVAGEAVSSAGAQAAGKAGNAMGSVGKGMDAMGKGAGGGIRSVFTGLAQGLERMATPKVALGILALTGITIPLWTAGKALQSFAGVSWADVGKGVVTIGALALTASLLSGASVPMLVGAAAIGALGGAMWVAGKAMQEFSVAFQQFAEVKWEQLASGLGMFGTGLSQLWDNAPNPVKLIALAGGITPLGLSMLPLAASVALMDTNKLGEFASKLGQLAAIDVAKIKAVAAAIRELNEANAPSIGTTVRTAFAGVVDQFVGKKKEEKGEEGKDKKDTEASQIVTTINQQLAKMDKSNEYLKVVAENMPALVQIANKQLEATMMTEKQKEEKETKPSQNSLKGSLGFFGI